MEPSSKLCRPYYSEHTAFYYFWRDQYLARKLGNETIYNRNVTSEQIIYCLVRGLPINVDPKSFHINNFGISIVEHDSEFITLRIPHQTSGTALASYWEVTGALFSEAANVESPDQMNALVDKAASSCESLRRTTIELNPDTKFDPLHWGGRAIGLWLWDYVQDHGGESKRGVQAEAIRTLKERSGDALVTLGFAASEERVFRNLLKKTFQCIEAGEVLPF